MLKGVLCYVERGAKKGLCVNYKVERIMQRRCCMLGRKGSIKRECKERTEERKEYCKDERMQDKTFG